MRKAIIVMAALSLVVAIGLWVSAQKSGSSSQKPKQKTEAKTSVPVKNEGWRITYGDPKARVKVEAFYPVGSPGHEFVLEFSKKLAQAFPGKVQAVVYDWTKPKGADEFSKRGLICGCFIINGKIQVQHKGKTVAFMKRPEMTGWNLDLLKAVVAEEVERVYREPTDKPSQVKGTTLQKTSANSKGVIEIFVPCGLAGPYGDLANIFQKQNPNIRLRPNVTGIVAILNQLQAGATPDIFLALGTYELTKLTEQGRFVEGSLVKCARIPLAVIVHKKNPSGVKRLEDLASPKVKKVITYPFQLSGGRGARQALEAAKIWDVVNKKVFVAKVPDQAKQLLKKGQADVGILYRTCLMESYIPNAPPVIEHDLIAVQTIPQKLYEPIYVAAVLVKGGKNLDAAREFLKLLQTPQARKVWQKWGFEPVEETAKPVKLNGKVPLFIYSGAAFRPPLEEMGRVFERKYGVPVKFNFTGSNCLLAQIMLSQQGDLFLPGEDFYIRLAEKRGYVIKSRVIGYFIPVILVRKGNPKGIRSLKDLAKPGVKVGLGDPKTCAIGEISEAILRKNNLTQAVHKNVVLRTAMAPELANALRLGGIDACINWDAIANYPWVRPAVEVIPIPPEQNLITTNTLAILKTTKNLQAAEKFLQFALTEGQDILRKHRFTPRDSLPPVYAKSLFSPVAVK